MVLMRSRLTLAAPAKAGPTYAMKKVAVRLFRSDLAPRSVRRANARKWLAAMAALGDKHVYRGGEVSWGHQSKGAHR
jgi:hypothetical protein